MGHESGVTSFLVRGRLSKTLCAMKIVSAGRLLMALSATVMLGILGAQTAAAADRPMVKAEPAFSKYSAAPESVVANTFSTKPEVLESVCSLEDIPPELLAKLKARPDYEQILSEMMKDCPSVVGTIVPPPPREHCDHNDPNGHCYIRTACDSSDPEGGCYTPPPPTCVELGTCPPPPPPPTCVTQTAQCTTSAATIDTGSSSGSSATSSSSTTHRSHKAQRASNRNSSRSATSSSSSSSTGSRSGRGLPGL